MKFPRKVDVKRLASGRYEDGNRPPNWDERIAGQDVIETSEGEIVVLKSDGDQTPPRAGWRLMLTSGDVTAGFTWTLSGFNRSLMHL